MKNMWVNVFVGVWLVVSALLPGSAYGAEWETLEPGGRYGQLALDMESIEWLDYDLVNVRVKYRNVYRYGDEDYGYSVSSLKLDCSRKRLASVRIDDYDHTGSLVSSVTNPGEPWYPVFPGSSYDRLFRAVCPVTYPLHTGRR